MRIKSLLGAWLAVAVVACSGGQTVVAPLPLSPTPIGPTQWMGMVRDDRGNPIPGATVTFWPPGDKLISNEAGQFSLAGYFERIYASKPGYENGIASDVNPTVTLQDIVKIPAGQSVRVTVRPDDSLGGPFGRYHVRQVHVFTGGDRIVQIHVVADDGGPVVGMVDYSVQPDCGDVCRTTLPTTFIMYGGTERLVLVHIPDTSTVSRTFTVVTEAEDP